jgi:hypothetical protein
MNARTDQQYTNSSSSTIATAELSSVHVLLGRGADLEKILRQWGTDGVAHCTRKPYRHRSLVFDLRTPSRSFCQTPCQGCITRNLTQAGPIECWLNGLLRFI